MFQNEKGYLQPLHGWWLVDGRKIRLENFHCLGGRPKSVEFWCRDDAVVVGSCFHSTCGYIRVRLQSTAHAYTVTRPAIANSVANSIAWLGGPEVVVNEEGYVVV